MESSLTVAIILRVTSLIRDWKALTFWESSMVSCRPSTACDRSLSDRAVTSSRMSSFSKRLSFLSFSRSSKLWILTRNVCGSKSSPPNFRHLRKELRGFSSSRESSSVRLRTLLTCSRRRTTSSTSLGTSGILLCTTRSCRCTSCKSMRKPRISSERASMASSPFFRSFSWMLDFSHNMQSSSLRSMSCVPVKFRVSTACSYFRLKTTISFSMELMIEFNLSISMTYCSTCSLSAAPFAVMRVFSFCNWSWLASKRAASARVRWSILSFMALSMRRISTSFWRIFSFSFISERCCEDFWMRVKHLFRSFLTTSYMVQNSFCFWLISWCFFLRSSSSSCFMATSSAVSRHCRCAMDASRASFSRFEARVLKCVAQCCSSSLSFFSSFCMSSICWLIASYSSFFSFSSVSCFKKAPMKRSTSAWMSSKSFFCLRISSSCCFVCFPRSFLDECKGPRDSLTLSLLICVRLY
mmetsp:Transcript_2201/g.7381  ORF Transcript_2201/g.7381 Transcript_2201/m.7381 type:complete len:468 (+) Transcript_2201:613-2016(+)